MENQAYRLPFQKIGEDVMIWGRARIVFPERIELGDSVIIDDFVLLMGGERTRIGSFCHIASHASIVGGGEFVMEDFAGVSGGGRVYTGTDDFHGGSLTNPTVPPPYRQPLRSYVRIFKHVIVGANAVVLPGVTLGEGAAIGAGSVVTRDCEPWTIYAGIPARPLGARRRDRIAALEHQLREELYDQDGRYIRRTRAREM